MGDMSDDGHKQPAEPGETRLDTAMQTIGSDAAAKEAQLREETLPESSNRNRSGRLGRETSGLDTKVAKVHKTVLESTLACISVNVTHVTSSTDLTSNDG